MGRRTKGKRILKQQKGAKRFLLTDPVTSPLGVLQQCAFIDNSSGLPFDIRVHGSYVMVLLLDGDGLYRDGNGRRQTVTGGDVIFVFPELAHWYGPGPGQHWDELYIIFDGPIFHMLHNCGILDESRPVCHLEDLTFWVQRISSLFPSPSGPSPVAAATREPTAPGLDALRQVWEFAAVLVEFHSQSGTSLGGPAEPPWLVAAKKSLEKELQQVIQLEWVAEEVGLSYESFRKRFQKECGVSPSRYRLQARVDAARAMLQKTELSNKEIAAHLGFSDECHFAKRFKQLAGVAPQAYRREFKASAVDQVEK